MKVLLIAGQLIGGGAEKQLAIFLENLQSDVEPCCYVLNSGGVWTERVKSHSSEFHVAQHSSKVSRVLECRRLISKLQPDLIHCWHTYPFVYPMVSRFLHRVPVVVNLRGELAVDSDSGAQTSLGIYRWLNRCDAIVSNSRHVLGHLETLKFSNKRYFVGNGIELRPRNHAPASNGAVRVTGIGSLKPLKNWAQLIRVCGQLVRDGHPLELTIYGEGPQREELAALCREWGLPADSVLAGFQRDVADSLTQQDILVHPSHSEGQPNAILEGLSAGLPVVASDLEACIELNDECGLLSLFPVDDDDACKTHLAALVGDPARRTLLGNQAREFIQAQFDPRAMSAKYVDIYSEVLGRRTAASS